jgi:hypothetical protein
MEIGGSGSHPYLFAIKHSWHKSSVLSFDPPTPRGFGGQAEEKPHWAANLYADIAHFFLAGVKNNPKIAFHSR